MATQATTTTTAAAVPVTADNFTRAETDMYFGMFAKRGAFGKFYHLRELPLEGTGVRPNCDTLYSQAVFDLDARPVTITLPDAGKRFMSMMVIDEDHYVTEVATAREITAIPRRKSAPAMALRQSALWSIRQTRKTSSRFTPCRIRSRWSSPVGPAS